MKKAVAIALVVLLLPLVVSGQEPPRPPDAPPPPPPASADDLWLRNLKTLPITKEAPGIYHIGEILIQKADRSISFPGQVNMDKGLLEYLLVRSGGKMHESLLRTHVEPYHLQIALLLLGFEGAERPLAYQGDPEKPRGESVEITIEYQDAGGKSLSIKPEQWIVRKSDKGQEEVKELRWVFTGSIVRRGQFLAQSEGSIAAIYHDPIALIDNASFGGESDKIWFAKEGSVPPVGTPVKVTIKKASGK